MIPLAMNRPARYRSPIIEPGGVYGPVTVGRANCRLGAATSGYPAREETECGGDGG